MCLAVCVAEFFGLMLFYHDTGVLLFFWAIEKVILCGTITFVALMCKELQEGSEALSDGDLNHKLDTSHMVLSFKEHGENLNRIGEGISVEETDAVTGSSPTDPDSEKKQRISEYAEVLLRQSKKLKKLLDDLLEASKATTGNLEVHPEVCDVSVLLSAAST